MALLVAIIFTCSFFSMFIFHGILTKIIFVLVCAFLGIISARGSRSSNRIDRNVEDLTFIEKIKFYRNKN